MGTLEFSELFEVKGDVIGMNWVKNKPAALSLLISNRPSAASEVEFNLPNTLPAKKETSRHGNEQTIYMGGDSGFTAGAISV